MQTAGPSTQFSAEPPAEPLSSKGKSVRNRLSKEGVTLLEAYIRDHPDPPGLAVRKHLLAQLHALPGLENYSSVNLTAWFKRHRSKKQNTTPTLKEGTIQQLLVLIRGQPDPTPDVLKVWSQLLHVPQEAIVAHLRSKSFEDYEEQPSPLNHLPTPVSTSPEPYYDNVPYKSDPTHSPRVPTLLPPYQHERIPHYEHPLSRKSLVQAVAEATSQPALTGRPTTAREFDEMFARYGKMMENIIQKNEDYVKQHSLCNLSYMLIICFPAISLLISIALIPLIN